MQVSNPNNVKIYNLSAGKSLPEWLSDRQRRSLQKQDIDVRRRIELLQDFDMPTASHCVGVSPDGQYICATGTYKPRIKCFDTAQMSLKFERGLDSDVVKFQFLGEDYGKLVFLQCDRYIELHSQFGRYYRLRIPKYGRDMAYHFPSCDLYIGGIGSDVYRINLEQGRFLSPLTTKSPDINCCEINPSHGLLACGTASGTVECFDPRVRKGAGILDITLSNHIEDVQELPNVTALKFADALNMAVGTSTGHILLYDIRSSKPLLVKDHQYELPIKSIEFQKSLNLVLSMDTKILKLWDRETGKAFTSIEPGTNLNDLCLLPNSGLLFMANEGQKILSYYIPTLGTAPKWCSFLDNLTEELEESTAQIVYDDYKFVTRRELEELGLSHLIGSTLLRAYMHGFFMDNRLYNKAKAIAEPFAYEEYRKNKIREKIDQERANRVRLKKLPKVNRDLAEKLMDVKEIGTNKKKVKETTSLLEDDRFSAMFSNPEFQINVNSEEYKLVNPVVSKLDKVRRKKQAKMEQFAEVSDEEETRGSDSESESSDDEHTWTKELKEQHKKLRIEAAQARRAENLEKRNGPKFYEIKDGVELDSRGTSHKKLAKKSLAERLQDTQDDSIISKSGSLGNRELTFTFKKSEREISRQQKSREHHKERKNIRRSAGDITKTLKQKPKFWLGKRVK
ncbi:nucleolar protein 10-like [Saccostrea cucullata]|uniref:nucleolar protein 10-like n=1 Tax=Saccostrea cuccullata TaxID=36930 RepID=UPI002ED1BF8C